MFTDMRNAAAKIIFQRGNAAKKLVDFSVRSNSKRQGKGIIYRQVVSCVKKLTTSWRFLSSLAIGCLRLNQLILRHRMLRGCLKVPSMSLSCQQKNSTSLHSPVNKIPLLIFHLKLKGRDFPATLETPSKFARVVTILNVRFRIDIRCGKMYTQYPSPRAIAVAPGLWRGNRKRGDTIECFDCR